MAWVYILRTESGKFYVGSTTDLSRRMKDHKIGQTPSTKRLGFGLLVFFQQYETLQQARSVEKRIKRLKRRDYIEKIIKDGYIRLTPP